MCARRASPSAGTAAWQPGAISSPRPPSPDVPTPRSSRPSRRPGHPAPRPGAGPRHRAPVRWRSSSVLALSAGVTLYVAASLRWEVPWAAGLVYAVMSLVCYLSYAADKSAARSGQWRTSERTLFWLTVVLNLLGFALLFTPLVPDWTPVYPAALAQRTQY